ncbi:MAG TPA: NAD(P)-binding domain-containing protein [Nitrolancea sp.]|nr:NAD(P)-binding domain-containing protein [Nitrolancea sp.]
MDGKIHQFVVIGAGPYGLSAASRLRSEGYDVYVFGEAMSFWEEHMPAGMFLRSSWDASNIGALKGPLSLESYERAEGIRLQRPIPLVDFVTYGRWVQRQFLPDLDPRRVIHVAKGPYGFHLTLDDGDVVYANRVIVATGLDGFAQRPGVFSELPCDLVSHVVDRSDLGIFCGKKVAVIGGGQSALESAAILHERGADVEVLTRAPQIRWLARSAALHSTPKRVQRLMYSPTDVGPPGLSWVVAWADFFRRLPKKSQGPLAQRAIRPAGASWLVPRLSDVPLTTGSTVINASKENGRLRLKLGNGGDRIVDHALLATGYRIDVNRYPFLDRSIVSEIKHQGGYPTLHGGFESTVAGLHFIGAASAISYSPVMRFVSGTWYTTDTLARGLKNRVGVVR